MSIKTVLILFISHLQVWVLCTLTLIAGADCPLADDLGLAVVALCEDLQEQPFVPGDVGAMGLPGTDLGGNACRPVEGGRESVTRFRNPLGNKQAKRKYNY